MTAARVILGSFAALTLFAAPGSAQETAAPASEPAASPKRYLFSSEPFHEDKEVFWKGFLTGLRGFENFADPIGNPLYFETPINATSARLLYLHHGFPDDSQLQGGDLNVAALQLRLAVTERLGIIATKDGYSWLNAGALPEEDGWNDFAVGFKYAFYADPEQDLLATAGCRFMFATGEDKVLQGNIGEASPFITAAKGFGNLQLMGNFTWRIPYDSSDGNDVIQWDVNIAYDWSDFIPGFYPTLEFHGLHYVSDGDRLPFSVGGLDYAQLGSSDVNGSTVVWFGVGGRLKFTPNASLGATYEYPLTNRDADIMGDRVTVDLTLSW
jgi:hypothetical protein